MNVHLSSYFVHKVIIILIGLSIKTMPILSQIISIQITTQIQTMEIIKIFITIQKLHKNKKFALYLHKIVQIISKM